ncbi:protein of unknown function [Taphrina deformans PYCC 5710]|uniref:Endoribonuclease YSH1 n=1 Tax=Taphrina deformans (strain PYCC 5710 / ATCC 11124 / CBS 356.35 / IMI 108563 / JCM 9778 / NBRC 8474) TaxID=1097556 RepID=R4XM10_TAPDE|nr:protein of unknown function [Taphrina deformans PYCC 5710]|eukprot:CCG84330.1 protein of unknown function [Taphrina deformans PYCC 5710]
MASKRAIPVNSSPTDTLHFTNLGAGNEVGRSCHIIQFKDKTIMLDAGVHPAYSGQASLPYYDEFDLSEVDILLISHFHLDHAASLPHVMQKTNFKGRVFMTHPTKAIYKWLMSDFVRVSSAGGEVDQLYSEAELSKSFESIEAVDYHSATVVNGIKFTAYHAGHVLGGAMYFIEIAGVKILFTGDYSREEDRHLNVAEVPPERPDILITESTYGTASHQPRIEKETRLTNLITKTVQRGGRVLMPVFALGRAQELLLILDEYWARHPELQHVPIYYISSLAKKCMAVYQTYIHTMNPAIRAAFSKRNPFIFQHISSLRSLDRFDDIGPSIMLASPGMLQNGNSRALLEKWCPDEKNLLFVTGYSVDGTMAKNIMNEPSEITTLSGVKVPRRMAVEELSFAAHVDFVQNRDFIDAVDARHVILVHGEQTNMGKLKSALLSKYSALKGTDDEKFIWNPKNCDTLDLEFKSTKIAKIVGSLAQQTLVATGMQKGLVSGILVQKDFEYKLMAATDLKEEASIGTTILKQRQTVHYTAGAELVKWHLRQMFGALEESIGNDKHEVVHVMNMINITIDPKRSRLIVEWESGLLSDSIADAVMCILFAVESSPASVKLTSGTCSHRHAGITIADRIERITRMLQAQFGEENVTETERGLDIKVDEKVANIDLSEMSVECDWRPLKDRITGLLKRAVEVVAPFAEPRVMESAHEQTMKDNFEGSVKSES